MIYNFLESSEDKKNSEIVIVGYPFDSTSSFRAGSRNGPNSLRFFSWNLETFSNYQKKDIHEKNYFDMGDVELPFGDIKKTNSIIYKTTKRLLNSKKKIISLGGEHSITYPIIKAFNEYYDDFILVVFDAHADLREEYLGVKFSHACVVRNCVKLLGEKRVCQLGIRSYTKEEFEFSKKLLSFNEDINSFDFNLIKGKRIYISIDLDVLDPSVFPGTGTPEAGGFNFKDFINFILKFQDNEIVGVDLVELSPEHDISGISQAAAAKIVREIILLL
ncbi:MAG: agmatinase [bacterium]|uniref:Agmatinase n=2 Tax=Bacteria candidate phyla TaxID=1783234 RepID=A0A117M6E2_UNCT6|nr:MAG: Agmatinase [candidate division TA06 bacterium 32_111]KUK86859.1 MAG: Agmatinase [candidate division TA06 bacterium 34_109]MDI6700752.1 agmatinase [bacterium]HAF07302.1 agmatinase [candidate division WOR-3 bacterium]HCP16464.1 agmatinase [candidate division WOR-3 bacterium]